MRLSLALTRARTSARGWRRSLVETLKLDGV